MEDMIIAGSGPAGLTAATYTARAGFRPLVLEGHTPGGQLIVSQEVENFPGFPEPISGMDLMDRFKKQAERFGARFKMETIKNVRKAGDIFEVTISSEMIETRTLIIATGAEAKRLLIPTEEKFYGKGISGCATCDGSFFRNKEVLVVGGGNTAMQDALFLTRFASKVTIVHRREYLRASSIEVERVKKNAKIKWLIPYVIEEITGNKFIEGSILTNCQTGKKHKIKCHGIFVAIGHEPQTQVFRNLVNTDEKGFIKIEAGSTRTSTPGVFACGDVRDPVYKQAVVAAGYGCMAAFDAERYIERRS